ncbi:hypothetical protein H4219_002809 [Mycoemilia scoparia]|uniref:Uncharacterized protein n=1 Tax=Mycoemilia scoparia TaxID=417184 RepID=A0A9W8DTJ4_9FUNG|nr:hypothetical protein H4219_002809 [Mycoemilia scoparia]
MIADVKKPDGITNEEYYNLIVRILHNIAPSKGFKAQYSSFGQTAKAVYTLNIASLILSSIVLITVICHFRHRGFSERPSFRLSGSIALADIIHSAMMVLMHQTHIINYMAEWQLRVVWFIVLGSLFTSLFITACIALQLHLTVILKKERLARKLNPWYELIGWSLGFIVVHPILYMCDAMLWIGGPNVLIVIDTNFKTISLKIWAMYIWLLLGIVYCLAVCTIVSIQLISMLRGAKKSLINFREGRNLNKGNSDFSYSNRNAFNETDNFRNSLTTDAPNNFQSEFSDNRPYMTNIALKDDIYESGHNHTELSRFDRANLKNFENDTAGPVSTQVTDQLPMYMKKRRRGAVFAIFRMMLYPIVPLVTVSINPIFVSIKYPTYNFCIIVLALAASQGIIESVVFFMNPMLDPMWGKIMKYAKKRLNREKG